MKSLCLSIMLPDKHKSFDVMVKEVENLRIGKNLGEEPVKCFLIRVSWQNTSVECDWITDMPEMLVASNSDTAGKLGSQKLLARGFSQRRALSDYLILLCKYSYLLNVSWMETTGKHYLGNSLL